jgi:hypothetical protein
MHDASALLTIASSTHGGVPNPTAVIQGMGARLALLERMRVHVNNTTNYTITQHSTTHHSTAQHSTAQHSTAQHSTAQHSTAEIFPTLSPALTLQQKMARLPPGTCQRWHSQGAVLHACSRKSHYAAQPPPDKPWQRPDCAPQSSHHIHS